MILLSLVVSTLVVQRVLGMPGFPPWCGEVVLPMVFLVAPALRSSEGHRIWWALGLGLAWDVTLEPVVGPGGISWTAAAVALHGMASFLADRTPRAWLVCGGVATVVLLIMRELALSPLGLGTPLVWVTLLRSAALTGLWCGAVGGVMALDLPSRWRRYHARRLR